MVVRKKKIRILCLIGLVILLGLILFFFWEWCSPAQKLSNIEKDLKISAPGGSSVTDYEDDHGWFGDGETNAEVLFPGNTDKSKIGIVSQNGWQSLPMPEDLSALIYGNESYGGCGNGRIRKTKNIKSGLYFYRDRVSADNSDRTRPPPDRFSHNFTFALYDAGKHILYYYTYDS